MLSGQFKQCAIIDQTMLAYHQISNFMGYDTWQSMAKSAPCGEETDLYLPLTLKETNTPNIKNLNIYNAYISLLANNH